MLIYRNTKLAVVEAKARDKPYTEGLAQAKRYAAKLALRFAYANAHARCALLSGEGWRVLLSDALLTELRALLGKAAVQVEM